MVKFLMYGSLRKGQYNFNRFNGLNYIKTTQIKGFDLFNLGAYPGIKSGEGVLTVDVVEATPETAERIDLMELGAGYTAETINLEGIDHTIYVYRGPVQKSSKIESGDWVNK